MKSLPFTVCAALVTVGTIAGPVAAQPAYTLTTPSTYTGRIPCADCEGINVTLTFRPNKTYAQRYVYVGKKAAAFIDGGSWVFDAENDSVTLVPANGKAQYFRLNNARSITLLDANGDPIRSKVNLTLTKSPAVVALDAPIGGEPQQSAPPATKGQMKLESTPWALVDLAGKPAKIAPGAKVPTLHFDGKRVYGNTGCNNLNGGYKASEGKIEFSPMATTMMMCMESAELEHGFLQMLGKVQTYAIEGNVLRFYNGTNELATFKAHG